jgi:hypothetical protein
MLAQSIDFCSLQKPLPKEKKNTDFREIPLVNWEVIASQQPRNK